MPDKLQSAPVRKSFARVDSVSEIPDLLAIQTSSYEEFLQDKMPVDQREAKGLQAVFKSMFPVEE